MKLEEAYILAEESNLIKQQITERLKILLNNIETYKHSNYPNKLEKEAAVNDLYKRNEDLFNFIQRNKDCADKGKNLIDKLNKIENYKEIEDITNKAEKICLSNITFLTNEKNNLKKF
jgi:hypothetical protein